MAKVSVKSLIEGSIRPLAFYVVHNKIASQLIFSSNLFIYFILQQIACERNLFDKNVKIILEHFVMFNSKTIIQLVYNTNESMIVLLL